MCSSGHDAETKTYPIVEQIDGGGETLAAPFLAPVLEPHRRGHNWAAVLLGPNAARMDRRSIRGRWRRGERYIDAADVAIGDAIEVGADYISTGGIRYGRRRYYVVADRTDAHIVLRPYRTAAQAIRAARQAAADAEEATA
ncbi:hypothetical protein KBTX_03711 [wastewater metagenome]|uniref:Uncharacterized protein n=2 Tax=unclassified sequences TaxID=12908 RepID=A0A5B8RFF2_9ZZZZ|nr:hypothetical protein [Arhodomonas sp. KWT]QEA07361.1 hypothetical protein KBTEX_03711 [uncultured organism]